jgi:hypothetical protein
MMFIRDDYGVYSDLAPWRYGEDTDYFDWFFNIGPSWAELDFVLFGA